MVENLSTEEEKKKTERKHITPEMLMGGVMSGYKDFGVLFFFL